MLSAQAVEQVVPPAATRDRKLVTGRWLDVMAAGVVSMPIGLLVLWGLRDQVTWAIRAPDWLPRVGAACFALLLVRMAWRRPLPFFGLRRLASYPPIWVGALLGVSLLCLALGWSAALRDEYWFLLDAAAPLTVLGFSGLGVILCLASGATLALRRVRPSKRTPAAAPSDLAASFDSFDRLQIWLRDDQPICTTKDDAFGHRRIALRIARRLIGRESFSQAVIGRLGAGKSTIRALVADELGRQPGGEWITLVHVELWPYETTRSAVEAVIRALVDALAQEVSVLSLRGLPSAYADAMTSAGGIWSAIARIQDIPGSAIDALGQIDSIAGAIGMRYVLWVEDLERFAGTSSSHNDPETPEESLRLAPLRALLLALDGLKSVSVITATTSLYRRFDLEKIARYVEEIPPLPEIQVGRVLQMFREGCLKARDIINPAVTARNINATESLDRFATSPEAVEVRKAMLGSRIISRASALIVLCKTPRTLKQALRSCLEIWEKLAGEIDFDDLLSMSLVREAQPDAFALIRENVDAFRQRSWDPEAKREATASWEKALAALSLDPQTSSAVALIVKVVFKEATPGTPQGFGGSRHADYWERFLSVPDLSPQERDQTVLGLIIKGDDEALAALLETSGEAVEDFAAAISTPRLRGLLRRLLRRHSVPGTSTWVEGHPRGFISIWRMWLRRSERGDLRPSAVLAELKHIYDDVIPVNLVLAEQIEHYFVDASNRNFLSEGPGLRAEAKRYFREVMCKSFVGKPDALETALQDGHGAVLRRLCLGTEGDQALGADGLPFERWREFAATLLDGARRSPLTLLEPVASLVTKGTTVDSGADYRYDFEPDQATRLFGSVEVVLGLFTEDLVARVDKPQVAAVGNAASSRPGVDVAAVIEENESIESDRSSD